MESILSTAEQKELTTLLTETSVRSRKIEFLKEKEKTMSIITTILAYLFALEHFYIFIWKV